VRASTDSGRIPVTEHGGADGSAASWRRRAGIEAAKKRGEGGYKGRKPSVPVEEVR